MPCSALGEDRRGREFDTVDLQTISEVNLKRIHVVTPIHDISMTSVICPLVFRYVILSNVRVRRKKCGKIAEVDIV